MIVLDQGSCSPIFHPSGKPIGFGGRIFGKEDSAKYLNSPETPLYKKSNVFYGLQSTRDAIRKEGYVVYRPYGLFKTHQSSIYPVVSVSGTAFTSKHASSISKITKKVVLLYDGDDAGGNAAIRAGLVLLKSGDSDIVRPPDGSDPDDWIEQSSKAKVLSAIQSPKEYIDLY